jgi:hypothetical protein
MEKAVNENNLYPESKPPEFDHEDDAVRWMVKELWEQRREMERLKASLSLQAKSVQDIAHDLGYKQAASLLNKPWNLPNFGKADIEGKTRKWLPKTVEAWFSIPEQERREKWESMNSINRRKAMGRVS